MSRAPRPLFVDTGGFYAAYDEDDANHEVADALFEGIAEGNLPYGPIFTSRYVLAELATLVLYRVGHAEAVAALGEIRESATFNVLEVGAREFDLAAEQLARYDDQDISFVDHLGGVLAADHDIEHVVAFDRDFATLGFTRVPVDTDEIS